MEFFIKGIATTSYKYHVTGIILNCVFSTQFKQNLRLNMIFF